MSTTSSKTSSPQSAIYCFHLSVSGTICFPEGHPVAAYLFFLIFPSHVSCLFFLLFNNVFQKAVPTQYMTIPMNLPSFYCLYDIPRSLHCMQHFFISYTIGPTDLLNPPPTPHFKLRVISYVLSEVSRFKHRTQLSSKFKHCTQLSSKVKHLTQLFSKFKHCTQLSSKVKHCTQLSSKVKHRTQLPSKVKHRTQLSSKFKHRAQLSSKVTHRPQLSSKCITLPGSSSNFSLFHV
jgi:hypothetical protein